MIILIAESKTMSPCQTAVTVEEYLGHRPLFENEANEIMSFISSLPVAETACRLKVSMALAAKSFAFADGFPDKETGYPALKAFTGEVFRAVDVDGIGEDTLRKTGKDIFIISSLYGLLRADDLIKPYRLDFKTECFDRNIRLCDFWKAKVTIALAKILKERGETEIVNLLPSDAAGCIDWKIIKAFTRAVKPDFKEFTADGGIVTPSSRKLKHFRGLMLREIMLAGIKDTAGLLGHGCDAFCLYPEASRPGLPVFIVNS